jgi:hypothetical protein
MKYLQEYPVIASPSEASGEAISNFIKEIALSGCALLAMTDYVIYPSQKFLVNSLGSLPAASSSTSQSRPPSFGLIRWAGNASGLYLSLSTFAKVTAFFSPVTMNATVRA